MALFLKNLKSQSLMSRLLWPVNTISFVLIFGFSIVMAYQHQKAIQEETEAKAEAVLNLLALTGEHFIATQQQKSLAVLIAKAERDIQYAVYYNENNQALTPEPSAENAQNAVKLIRPLNDISAASSEQESSLTKTVTGMHSISKTTEVNSEVAYQSSKAASVLQVETLNLQKVAQSISKNIVGRRTQNPHTPVSFDYKISRFTNKRAS